MMSNFFPIVGEKLKNHAYVTYDPVIDRISFIYHNDTVEAFIGTQPGESVELKIDGKKIK